MSRSKQRKMAANFYPGWEYRFYKVRYALGVSPRQRLDLALRRYPSPMDARHRLDVLTGRPLSDDE